MQTIILLTISNLFMNLAWYGHLKFKDQPLWILIFASWGIAFFEYAFQVPANRAGAGVVGPAAQGAAGMHHARRFFHRRLRPFPLADYVEYRGLLRLPRRGGFLRF